MISVNGNRIQKRLALGQAMRFISHRPMLAMLLFWMALATQCPWVLHRVSAQEPRTEVVGLRLPNLESDKPEYCRLSFPGSESPLTILLILDGPTLYVDRNANGDLTEENERVQTEQNANASERDLHFRVGEIKAGEFVHESIHLIVTPLENFDRNAPKVSEILKANPRANAFQISAEIQHKNLVGSGDGRILTLLNTQDTDGILQFGVSPDLAPLINFGGPLEVRLLEEARLRPGSETEIVVAVGTKGGGPGTFAAISYENVIPDDAWPKLTLTTNSSDGGPPIISTFEMQHRC